MSCIKSPLTTWVFFCWYLSSCLPAEIKAKHSQFNVFYSTSDFFSSLLFHSFFTSLNSISFFIFIVCPFFDLFQELRTFNVLGASPFILPKKMRKLLIIMRNFIPNHDKRKEGEGKKGERIVWLAGWFMIAGKLKSKPFHLD